MLISLSGSGYYAQLKKTFMIAKTRRLWYNAVMKVKDIIKRIEKDGWYLVTSKGSHRQYKHINKPGRVTISGNLNDDIAPGTLNSVMKQAQIKEVK